MIEHNCTVTNHEITEDGSRCSCGYFDSNLVICKHCRSRRIVHVRLDSDWGDGGDVSIVNSKIHYNPQDFDMRPDIDVNVCLNCWTCQ